jgi:hypothetical protein
MAIAGGVMVVLLLIGAIMVNVGHHGGAPGGPASPAAKPPSSTGGNALGPGPAPTQAVDPGLGSRVVSGVPVGYPQSANGAVAAAVNYELARSSAAYLTDAATRHAVLRAIMTANAVGQETSAEDAATAQFASSIGLSSSSAADLVARAASLGTRVDSYSAQVATVQVWTCGLVGISSANAPLPVTASWVTYTLTLQWEGGDWKLSAVTSTPGPTPLQSDANTPSSVSDFRTADKEFHEPPFVG